MRHLMVPVGEQQMRELFSFHAELVLRHVRASSLPMRLWGWEQTEDLIALSHKHRWSAKAYLVSRGLVKERGTGRWYILLFSRVFFVFMYSDESCRSSVRERRQAYFCIYFIVLGQISFCCVWYDLLLVCERYLGTLLYCATPLLNNKNACVHEQNNFTYICDKQKGGRRRYSVLQRDLPRVSGTHRERSHSGRAQDRRG